MSDPFIKTRDLSLKLYKWCWKKKCLHTLTNYKENSQEKQIVGSTSGKNKVKNKLQPHVAMLSMISRTNKPSGTQSLSLPSCCIDQIIRKAYLRNLKILSNGLVNLGVNWYKIAPTNFKGLVIGILSAKLF